MKEEADAKAKRQKKGKKGVSKSKKSSKGYGLSLGKAVVGKMGSTTRATSKDSAVDVSFSCCNKFICRKLLK
jgi:hypothetical protein